MNLSLPKKHLKSFYWRDYIIIVLGLVLFSIGYVGFLIPYKVVTGGLGGIALLVKYALGTPLWITMITVNAILLSFAWFIVGRKYVFNTAFSTLALTIILGFAEQYITEPFIHDATMSILVGSVITGIGLGLVFSANSSTGGGDIIAAMITKYHNISMGRVLTYIDAVIVMSSYILFQSLETIIIGFIITVILYYAVDVVVNGSRQSVQFFIFSEHYDEIATHIVSELNRGCSVVDGVGWYSKEPQKIIILMTRRNESTSVFRLIKQIDKNAFITQTNVSGVYGKGFEPMIGTK